MSCEDMIYSEQTADFIGNRNVIERNYPDDCIQPLGSMFSALYLRLSDGYGEINLYGYNNIPKLYGLLDTGSMEASGILKLREQPSLFLNGEGVLLGFVDTGIDFAGSVFLKPDKTTRVVSIWDQTIPGETQGKNPRGFLYGTEFTQEELNAALRSENPYRTVPTKDKDGHGTFLASVAAGNELTDSSFTGAAPGADIAMVKLKPAKESLRRFYRIREDAVAYQENDIMAGVSYLVGLANRRNQPLVLCIALGSNSGAHNGGLPLARQLDYLASSVGIVIAAGTGNETARGHHYEGRLSALNEYEDVEVRVAEGENGFVLELWAQAPETYSVAVRSPDGETIPRIFVRPEQIEILDFALSPARVEISYRISVTGTGDFLAILRFLDVTPGVWTIRVYNDLFVSGSFHMWLPMEHFIRQETQFLSPSEFVTLTSPSDASGVISVSTYNHRNDSIYLYSGRGFAADGRIRPDLAAPGVDIEGYTAARTGASGELRRVQRSGSSIAAAHTAGAAALFCQWTLRNGIRFFTGTDVKTYLIRGANRDRFRVYPNREWGFGTLDVYGALRNMQTQQL